MPLITLTTFVEQTVQDSALEAEVAQLLNDLSDIQDELLQVLTDKRQHMVSGDLAGMTALQPREERMIARLQACQEQRQQLLARAAEEGLPATDVRSLASALPKARRGNLGAQVKTASSRARLLEHQSLTNWVLVQRTLIHLSQMLEIIATGGRLQPTYGRGEPVGSSGSLLDQAA